MSVIPKHEGKATKQKSKQVPQPENVSKVVLIGPETRLPSPSMQHDINHVAGLGDIESSLDYIARAITSLTSDDKSIGLALSQNRYGNPVQLTLGNNDYDDTMDRLVTAFERIADSVAKLAGLNRPRLESWHEQDEYEPRYKSIAVDGGAPGPKQA